ncbi:MAG: DUF4097 family beta strand repeat-containing protein [Saprospiraceae bacterium]
MRYILLFILLSPSFLVGQNSATLQVVTKVVEDNYAYRDGYEVAIEGEKAEIFVETWDKKEISVRVEMTAKHAELDVARHDLESLVFSTNREKNKFYLRNSRRNDEAKPESQLTIHYYITLPEECPVYVKNHFGSSNISNLRNRVRIYGEFSQININNVQGLLDIRTRFGDIMGDRINGNVSINARRSDVDLTNIGGSFTINAQYGKLRLAPTAALTDLTVFADKSDVLLIDPLDAQLAYTLTTTQGDMVVPGELRIRELESAEGVRRVMIRPDSEVGGGAINVHVTFGELRLEAQERELKRVRVNR